MLRNNFTFSVLNLPSEHFETDFCIKIMYTFLVSQILETFLARCSQLHITTLTIAYSTVTGGGL
jgi:hypothetical protein